MSADNQSICSAIDRQNRQFEAHFAAHDAKALVNAYFVADADHPTASPPGGVAPLTGRAALIEMFTAQFEAVRSIRLETIRLDTSPDMAFEMGRAHLSLASGDKATGRFCAQWRRTGSEWRVAVDFFGTDGWQG